MSSESSPSPVPDHVPDEHEIRRWLSRCRPLNDPVRFWATLAGWATIASPVILIGSTAIAQLSAGAAAWPPMLLIGSLTVGSMIAWLGIQPLRVSAKKPKVLFLRAFYRDDLGGSEGLTRTRLRTCLPGPFSLGGIRAPKKRMPFYSRFLGEGVLGLFYLGSNRFELEAEDKNWIARLLASAAAARAIVIDLRSLTPHVHDEIELATSLATENHRLYVLTDHSRTRDEWLDQLALASKSNRESLGDGRIKFLQAEDLTEGSRESLGRCVADLAGIPDTPMGVSPAAFRKVRSLVAENDWATSFWRTPFGTWILFSVLIIAATWLLARVSELPTRWLEYATIAVVGILYVTASCRTVACSFRQRRLGIKSRPSLGSAILCPGFVFALWGGLALLLTAMARIREEAKSQQTRADLLALSSGVMAYKVTCERLPTREQGLAALVEKPQQPPTPTRWVQIMDRLPLDAWGNDYQYTPDPSPSEGYELRSAGPDGKLNTKDDLSERF